MKKYNIIFMMAVLFAFVTIAGADIIIVEPANDNPVFDKNFVVSAYVNDTNIKSAQYRILGFPWTDFEQITATEWQASVNISQLQNGTYTISAKYNKNNDFTWVYVASATQFSILKPSANVTATTPAGQKKNFRIEYGSGLRLGRSVFIKVFDKDTGETVEGANVSIFDGFGTQSLFGRTSENGRVFAGVSNMENDREYEIIVEKVGYEDYSEIFTAWIEKPKATPTPEPTPSPEPTPEKKFYPDLGEYVTEEEYKLWRQEQEEKKQKETTTPLPTIGFNTPTPKADMDLPWGLGLVGIVLIGIAYSIKTQVWKKFKKQNKEHDNKTSDVSEMLSELNIKTTESANIDLICDKCKRSIAKVSKDFPFKDVVLKEHYEKFHEEKTSKKDEE